MDCQNCALQNRVESLEHEQAKLQEKLEKQVINQVRIDERYQHIIDTLNGLSAKVETLVGSDSKKWNALTKTIWTAFASGIVGYIVAAILK